MLNNNIQDTNTDHLRVNGKRLWNRLMAMAEIGATKKGGCNRQALTSLDKEGRKLFIQWCEDAGCTAKWDAIGNLFIRRSGMNNDLPAVMTGSHLDTQPTGGKFDGVYGVLAGLEVIESLNDHDLKTEHPIEIVAWTNEEGVRFSPAMMGSGVFSGVFDLHEMLAVTDKTNTTVEKALKDIDFVGSYETNEKQIKASFEVHIEQGPILEQEKKQIGVVLGIQGIRWYDLTIVGQPVHAGPTPMEYRRDPVKVVSKIVDQLFLLAEKYGPWARVTFGDINATPGSRNTVPETVTIAVDLRNPDQEALDQMDKEFRSIVTANIYQGMLSDIRDEWNLPAVEFDESCVESVESSVQMLGYSYKKMVSGAGHDSGYVSRVAPTSMIFVPCEEGISHNEAENAKPEDLEAGCNVLFHSMLKMAVGKK